MRKKYIFIFCFLGVFFFTDSIIKAKGRVIFQDTFTLYADYDSDSFKIDYNDPSGSGLDFDLEGKADVERPWGGGELYINSFTVKFNRKYIGSYSGLSLKDIRKRREYVLRDGRLKATIMIVDYGTVAMGRKEFDMGASMKKKGAVFRDKTDIHLSNIKIKVTVERTY